MPSDGMYSYGGRSKVSGKNLKNGPAPKRKKDHRFR